jgi:hypothetical protein
MSHPRVTVLAHDQGFAPLTWLAPFTACAFKARATLTRVIEQILSEPQALPVRPQFNCGRNEFTGISLGDDAATRRRHPQGCVPHDGQSHVIAISG